MSTVADWYLDQLATHNFLVVIAVHAVAIRAICLGLAAAIDWIDDRYQDRRELQAGLRAAERHANHPANRQQRKEKP